ncbi:hypothetical protein TSMEX_001832 [Taenia solium]|eukprot:TsM_000149600 transcript=TsM_000149600 gene=TsM_000149600
MMKWVRSTTIRRRRETSNQYGLNMRVQNHCGLQMNDMEAEAVSSNAVEEDNGAVAYLLQRIEQTPLHKGKTNIRDLNCRDSDNFSHPHLKLCGESRGHELRIENEGNESHPKAPDRITKLMDLTGILGKVASLWKANLLFFYKCVW